MNIVDDLEPSLIVTKVMERSSDYIDAVKKIQCWWKMKYKARMMMFKNYIKRHVRRMIKQHPHLQCMEASFSAEDQSHKIIIKYMIEESLKFKDIYL